MDDKSRLNEQIDILLADARPDRYDATDHSWRQPVYDAIALTVPVLEARQIAAKQLVDQREARATRRANKVFREVGRTRTWPLSWLEMADLPISINEQRVCLRSATSADLVQWATDERRDAAAEHSARHEACLGAEWMAREMDALGYTTLFESMGAPA